MVEAVNQDQSLVEEALTLRVAGGDWVVVMIEAGHELRRPCRCRLSARGPVHLGVSGANNQQKRHGERLVCRGHLHEPTQVERACQVRSLSLGADLQVGVAPTDFLAGHPIAHGPSETDRLEGRNWSSDESSGELALSRINSCAGCNAFLGFKTRLHADNEWFPTQSKIRS